MQAGKKIDRKTAVYTNGPGGTIIRSQREMQIMQSEEYDPAKIIGTPYHRGMLPYGGGVDPDGRVVFALSREDAERRVQKYRAITQ